ncbi:hypothetical protein SAMN05216275_10524 [Streptosporangium canum]|uniref:Uncharacterized protein n=1 Tax=Streptosporangium canum TaxID=324952 RepID=A0A1I3L625_9ACTN|nr:hypothetical protein [Streptosporangium canum]SFI80108.1 hypothetical protein SAMN05216275_10524 [Streptosporangium canum]
MTDGGFPTEIYFVTGIRARGQLFGSTGPLKLSIQGSFRGGCAKGVKVWKLDPPGWRDVTNQFLTEEGYKAW